MTLLPIARPTPRPGALSGPFGGPGYLPTSDTGLDGLPNLPFTSTGILDMIDTPDMGAPPESGGLFGRIARTPGASRSLMALGAGLLSGNSFADGLAKGGMAFQNALDDEAERRRPKTQFLANGAVRATVDPITGKTTYEVTPAQDALKDIVGARAQGQLDLQDSKNDAAWQRTQATLGSREKVAGWSNDTRRDIADGRNQTAITVAGMTQDGRDKDRDVRLQLGTSKPAPASATAKYQELGEAESSIGQTLGNAGPIMAQLESGKLPLGFFYNPLQEIALKTGIGANADTQRYALYKQFKEQLRNALLIANKGVQTDGDAERAMREIESGSGDPASVLANFRVVVQSLERRKAQAAQGRQLYEDEYGLGVPSPVQPSRTGKPRRATRGTLPGGITWELER